MRGGEEAPGRRGDCKADRKSADEQAQTCPLFTIRYLFPGMILDTLGMIVLTRPFVFPMVKSLGFDPIWFGVYMTLMQEVAMPTPPIGLNVFVMAKIAPDVRMVDIFRGVIPFVVI